MEKWYSDGLTAETAEKLEKRYAKIEEPIYGINDRDILALQFSLMFEDSGTTHWQLIENNDIRGLLGKTKSYDVQKLEGKIIEAFMDGRMLKGLSVNENLV